MVAACVLAMAGVSQTKAGDLAQEEQIAVAPPPDGPMMGKGQLELTPAQMDHILAEIKEKNPQEANELTQLRQKDPNAFRNELRNHMREQFMSRMLEQKGTQQGGPVGQQHAMPGPGAPPKAGHDMPGPEFMRERIQERTDEYLKCLKENYPDEATKLEQLKKDNPEQYVRALMISGKKYGRICDAVKDDPNLAKVLKQQMELKDKRAELLKQIRATTDEKQKKTLTAELEQIVGQQFDLIVKRKQMAYEDLTRKLADLQKEVNQRKAEVEKWNGKDFKSQKVKERVTELVNQPEKFEWDN
jgi:hypothetical protein